jgi:DNA-binding Xre family transcriptional regulator
MFLKNSMFGTLVMNSLNLIHYGIDKYVAKNNIAKIAKACGLTENQVGDLIKFV